MAAQNSNNEAPPQKAAFQALGGAMMGELPAVEPESEGDDALADEIMSTFTGSDEKAGKQPNSSEGGSGDGASSSDATHAAEGGEGQAQPATPSTSSQPGQQGDKSQAPAQPQPAAAAPAATPASGQGQSTTPDPTVQALQAQVQALIAQNAQLQQHFAQQGAGSQAPQSGQTGQPGGQVQPDPLMDYRFSIPDDIASAIYSDDMNQAKAGLAHLVNSMARITHERVLKSMDGVLQQRFTEFQGNMQRTTEQEQMRQQYYQDFPQHQDPGIQLIVGQEAQAMWAQNPQLQWDKNSRSALGARVNARLGMQTPQQQESGVQAPVQAQPAPRPAAQMGTSNRPQPSPGDNDGNFIHDVLTA